MSHFTYQEKTEALMNWAQEDAPETFDSEFIESLYERVEKGQFLTIKQEAAIDHIIEKFGIDVEAWA